MREHVIFGESISRTQPTMTRACITNCPALYGSVIFVALYSVERVMQKTPGILAVSGHSLWFVWIWPRPGGFCWTMLPLLICVW